MKFPSGQNMQLDVFVPELRLALEYQGQQHFAQIYAFGCQEDMSYRDQQKKLACKENGITLVAVPYWWDFKLESLAGTIQLARSDLALEGGTPIPDHPPNKRQKDQ